MILETLSCLCSWKFLLLSTALLPILWLVYKFVGEKLSPLQKIPRPPGGLPLVGHLFTLLRSGGFLEMTRSWTEKYAPIFTVHPGFGIGIGRTRRCTLLTHSQLYLHSGVGLGLAGGWRGWMGCVWGVKTDLSICFRPLRSGSCLCVRFFQNYYRIL